jgi:DNA replication protein DnaC
MDKADGSYSRALARLAKLPLLILDDWGLNPLQPAERHDLLEVLEFNGGRWCREFRVDKSRQ